jgi:hypothetical protein
MVIDVYFPPALLFFMYIPRKKAPHLIIRYVDQVLLEVAIAGEGLLRPAPVAMGQAAI